MGRFLLMQRPSVRWGLRTVLPQAMEHWAKIWFLAPGIDGSRFLPVLGTGDLEHFVTLRAEDHLYDLYAERLLKTWWYITLL